ncbi:MAG: hypothetical protein QM811_05085 [Pirellulales bacterium]
MIAWFLVIAVSLLIAAVQFLTGCWIAFYLRVRDPLRATKTLLFCLSTRRYNGAELRVLLRR